MAKENISKNITSDCSFSTLAKFLFSKKKEGIII